MSGMIDLDAAIAAIMGSSEIDSGDKYQAAHTLRAHPAAPVSAGKVKALVWELTPDRDPEFPQWRASTVLGRTYQVFKAWWGTQGKWAFVFDVFYHTEAEAKAAAQADYEARILAALSHPAQDAK